MKLIIRTLIEISVYGFALIANAYMFVKALLEGRVLVAALDLVIFTVVAGAILVFSLISVIKKSQIETVMGVLGAIKAAAEETEEPEDTTGDEPKDISE